MDNTLSQSRCARMNTSRSSICIVSLLALLAALAPILPAQTGKNAENAATVQGTVCDSQGLPVAAAAVSLEGTDPAHSSISTTDTQGRFRFTAIPAGTYSLHAKLSGYQDRIEGPFTLDQKESKSITLLLTESPPPKPPGDASKIEFSDEPQFTVSGVTDTTNLGGHGSATFVRNRDALSKDAASLAKEGTDKSPEPGASAETLSRKEASLRAMLDQQETANLHAQLAEIEESEGHPLEAVRDYQRAAEMEPSEPYLFAWGAELLLHHAYEPAIEIFNKGHRLYPRSVRMLLGLGAARYAQGTREEAAQILLQACDLDPVDPTPYLFLGRLQAIENIEPPGWTERLKRFVTLHPENAMAHYLYAVALSKQGAGQGSNDSVEFHLKTAVRLDAHLGSAYLQLGIICAQRQDFSCAIVAFQKTIENMPLPDEAHYRLAQVYRAVGEHEKARAETQRFKQVTERRNRQVERERHLIPQFVYTLRGPASSPQPATTTPH
jgi:tetratricopeptide (TPR) repeat protein